MRILLAGKTGLLGRALYQVLSKEHEVFAPLHKECDVLDKKALSDYVQKTQPELIINATGYTKVDKAEEEKEQAFRLNQEAVRNMAETAADWNIALMHFSSDYVFDGENSNGYYENDLPDSISTYGKSKAAGEQEVLSRLKKFYLVRTSWVYGPGGVNFVDTMLEMVQSEKPLKVVNDQRGCPTYTLDLAQAVSALLKGFPYGIYHMVNSGTTTWYEFATRIFSELGMPKIVLHISSKELSRPAKRPACSILKNTKFPPLRPWEKALEAYLMDKTLIL